MPSKEFRISFSIQHFKLCVHACTLGAQVYKQQNGKTKRNYTKLNKSTLCSFEEMKDATSSHLNDTTQNLTKHLISFFTIHRAWPHAAGRTHTCRSAAGYHCIRSPSLRCCRYKAWGSPRLADSYTIPCLLGVCSRP